MGLIGVIGPVFALILLGAVARQVRLLEPAGLAGLTDVVYYLAMPALLLGAIAEGPGSDLVGVATVYFSACLLVFAVGLGVARLLRLGLARAAMLGLNASYGNTVMLGIPMVAAVFGKEALAPLLAIIALHSAVLLPLAGMLVELGTTGQRRAGAALRSAGRGVVRNPIIMSIFAAFVLRWLSLRLPGPVQELLRLLGAAGPPMALICLGAALPKPGAASLGAETLAGAALKLVGLPALVWLIGRAAGLEGLPLTVAVLTGGLPTGANAFLLARRAEGLVQISAGVVVVTTVLAPLSLSALLGLLR